MSSVSELAVLLESALSNVPPSADVKRELPGLLQQIAGKLTQTQGCEEFSDSVFEIIPSIVLAAGVSDESRVAAEHLLAVAANNCASAREVFTAIGAALSEALRDQEGGGESSSSPELLRSLVKAHSCCLARIPRKWVQFLEEHLSLSVRWLAASLERDDSSTHKEEDANLAGFLEAWSCAAQHLRADASSVNEIDGNKAGSLLCRSALQAANLAVECPNRLKSANKKLAAHLPAANATLSGKLLSLEPVVTEVLQDANRTLCCLKAHLPLQNVDDLFAQAQEGGAPATPADMAVAACCAVLHPTPATPLQAGMDLSLEPSTCPSTRLRHLNAALRSFTDMAARHESVPIALVPLLAVSQSARQLYVAGTLVEDGYVDLLHPILGDLSLIMSHNPVEIVRTCAYEALNTLLDCTVPSARLLCLRHLITMPSTAAAVVALQRLRLEVSPAIVKPPFTRQVALQLALPFLQKGDFPGWNNPTDVVHNADVIAAALSVYRFIILQELAARRNSKSADDLPLLLQPPQLQHLVDTCLKSLKGCVDLLLRQHKPGEGDAASTDAFLGVLRVEEVLERTLEAATELLKL